MLDRPCCRRQVRSLVDPRAGGLGPTRRSTKDSRRSGTWSNTCSTPPTDVNRFIRSRRPFSGDLLVIGNWLLQAFLDMAGTGNVGPTLRVASDSPSDPDQNLPRLEQPHGRPYLSIFGEVTIERTCYGQDRVVSLPLTGQLHLPQRQYSYLLQQWRRLFVVDDAHAEAIRKLEDDPRPGDHRESVGGPEPRAGQRCRGVLRPSSGSGRRRGRTALGGDSGLQGGTPG